jgi:hypothetical protein
MTNSNELIRLVKQNTMPELHIFEERFHYIDGLWVEKDLAVEVKAKQGFYHEVYITKKKYEGGMMNHKHVRYINLMRFEFGREEVYTFNLKKLPEPKWEWIYNPDASNELYTGWEYMWMGKLHINTGLNITNLIFKK